jgi:hypothetical protein
VAYVLRANASNGVYYVEFSTPRIVESSANTASTVVLRDASGNFSAGTVSVGALTSAGLVTFASLKGTGATTVTDILNDSTMATASATTLATSASIKTYVDNKVATVDTLAEVLANGNTTGANDIIVNAGQKIRTPAVAAQDGTSAISIANSTGALTLNTALADSNLATISTAGKVSNSATTATSANTASAIVARDGSGNFSAGTITATLNGAAPAGSLSGTTLASGVTASSLTSVGTLSSLTVSGDLTVDTSTLKVDSANNRVGIGTASPGVPLDVFGTGAGTLVRVNNATTGKAFMGFANNGTNVGFVGLSGGWEGDSTSDMSLIAETGYGLRFYTNGSPNERLTIDTSGNLGLGVTPSAWGFGGNMELPATNNIAFQGSGNVLFNAFYSVSAGQYLYKTTAGASRYQSTAGSHIWYIAPSGTAGNAITFTQAMTLDASGNLNLGQASSALQSGGTGLTVYGSSASEIKFLNSTSGTAATDGTALVLSSSDFNINNRESGAILFGTANTERARITSGGALLVNTTAITYSSERFAVISAANSNAAAFKNDGGGSGANAYTVAVSNTASSGDNAFVVFATETSDTTRGSITYNRAGGVVAYNTTSDYRAKDVFGAWQDAGQTIDALTVYRGKMKGATIERPMLIAHEAQAVAPYCVTGEKNAVDADGNPIYQQMDHSVLVPLLIAEVQSLRARVAALEA